MTIPSPSPETLLDRQCEQRSEPGYLEAVLKSAARRVVVFHRGKALMDAGSLGYLDPAALPAEPLAGTTHVYLAKALAGHGLPNGTDLVLQVLPYDAGDLAWVPTGADFAGYRDVASTLNAGDVEVFIEAQAVANWHATHAFCPRCGGPTESLCAGWMRRCDKDGSEHFPRTDPAVIVAIVGPDDKILLANNFAWEPNKYSTVAGFVEAGESGERAAVREIAEEVGVVLDSLSYVGSQAWPFPRSLMLGFMGYTKSSASTPDNVEVRATRWFSREELQAEVLNGNAGIPGRLSIARELVERWYGGCINEPGDAVDAAELVAPGATL
ncbi:NAD+ diphosphatase [Arthrobacter alpinus]|uniref:NAD(+) diphosphatase n=1 Tax=Arthrobacter alpinus TaxID=656366 RepID=A0A1H5DVS1_9MICC|nr:NAD(+) diphosphatase [Arthrobacter alpinus]SED82967.1 NAD+ diphosphatase [Arthrobacter alpinus]